MKKTIISLVFLSLFLSCGTEKTALEMKKGEIREDTGLFVINKSKNNEWFCFFEVNKRKSKIVRDYLGLAINMRDLFSLYQISEPVSNLRKIKILDDVIWDDVVDWRYVWVKLTFHAEEDMKGESLKKGASDFHGYKTLEFSGGIKIDSIQALDKAKEKIYEQTMDSLIKVNATYENWVKPQS